MLCTFSTSGLDVDVDVGVVGGGVVMDIDIDIEECTSRVLFTTSS